MAKTKKDTGIKAVLKKPIRVTNIKNARRLLASIIYEFQLGAMRTDDAKTLAYLLIKYAELYKVETLSDIEDRIQMLEAEVNAKSKKL